MILIRGIKGEQYAKKINEGIVDCRDVLSALLRPPVTGYAFSDYYEKNLVNALSFFSPYETVDIHNPDFLFSLIIDYFVPHLYLTYFHILNKNSLEWLENFDDDYSFIAINVKLDRITNTIIGSEYFGSQMAYVDSIKDLNQIKSNEYRAACMCSIENLFENKIDMNKPLQILNTLSFPLLCREKTKRFSDIENEFRLIAFDCPTVKNGCLSQATREIRVIGESGNKCSGTLYPGTNSILNNDFKVMRNDTIALRDFLEKENGRIILESVFKPINIKEVSAGYQYVGNKNECAEYIRYMCRHMPKDEYVDRTVRRKYKIEDLNGVVYSPSYRTVEYK